jgi:replicative DNA helicase
VNRMPPHNPEAEQRLLGCMLLKFESLQEIIAEYRNAEELFFDNRNSAIFAAMRDENSNDPVRICELLRNRGIEVGGFSFVSSLGNHAASGTIEEAREYAEVLVRDYTRRKLIEAAFLIDKGAFETEDASEALATAERAVMAIGENLQSDSDPDMKTLVSEAMAEIEAAFNNKGVIRGLKIGFGAFDWMTHGLKEGQMIVIGARPGIGKTSLAMNIVENVAVDQKYPVGVFSLEMTGKELIHRMACSRSKIDSSRAQDGELHEIDFTRMSSVLLDIRNAPIRICERGGLTISQLSARARRMHQRSKLKLIVIDYLQLMQSRIKGNRNDQITEISNGVKTLAKELKIPIIVLCQLSRDVEKGEREPRLSDLRDSGSIEQDADLVMLLHPQKKKEEDELLSVDALIPKHRGGPVGKLELLFDPKLTRFFPRAKGSV